MADSFFFTPLVHRFGYNRIFGNYFYLFGQSLNYDLNVQTSFIQNLFFFKFLINFFRVSGIFSFVFLPVKCRRFVFLKSPHVHKKAREQLEIRIYRFLFTMFFFDLFLNFKSVFGSTTADFNIIFYKLIHEYEIL
jgi:hypothetical protein